MNATGSVNTRANDFGVHNQASPDESIQALKEHIGSRSVGGRFVSWVKNSGGLTAKDQNYHAIFQKALATKLGGQAEVQKIFADVGFSTSKPLSSRKIEKVMVEVDKRIQSQKGLDKTQQTSPGPGAKPGPTPLQTPGTTTGGQSISGGDSHIDSQPGSDAEYQARLDLGSKLSEPTSPPPGLLKIDRSAPQTGSQIPLSPQDQVDTEHSPPSSPPGLLKIDRSAPQIPMQDLHGIPPERLSVGTDQSTSTPQTSGGDKADSIVPGMNSQEQAKQALKKDYQESVDPGVTFSSSALKLRSSLEAQLKGDDIENFMAAHQILRALNLKPNEEVTPEHEALAEKLVQRYEDARGTDLHKELQEPGSRFPAYFGATFKAIITNGWDPRVDLLTTGELVSLNTYTDNDYTKINQELHGEKPMSSFTQLMTSLAVQGLNKLPEYTGMTVRGTNLPRRADRDCVPGAAIVNYGFTSTSAASAFRGTHQFVINSPGGRDISFLSRFPKEKEVVFAPAHQFRVLDRTGDVEYNPQEENGAPNDPGVASVTITLV